MADRQYRKRSFSYEDRYSHRNGILSSYHVVHHVDDSWESPPHGVINIETADQTAEVKPLLKSFPYAGEMARAIFALGIIGTGLLAVPVLAGSSGYALADAFGRKEGLGKKFNQAKAFYLVIGASIIIGLGINFANIDPLKALIYTVVINVVLPVPILFAIMKIANDKKMSCQRTNRNVSNVIGGITLFIMGISVVIMGIGWFI